MNVINKASTLAETKERNLLLTKHKFIPFGKFDYDDIDQALTKLIATNKQYIKKLEQIPHASWPQINQLHIRMYKLNQVWNIVGHLISVGDSNELRQLQAKFQPLLTDLAIGIGQNKTIYNHYKLVKQHEYQDLDLEIQKVIDNELREFILNGIALPPLEKDQFKQIQNQLNELSTKFEQNLQDATDKFEKIVPEDELPGVPSDIMNSLLIKQDGDLKYYKLSLQMPCYYPIMQFCDNRDLREELYYNYNTRSSEFGEASIDNSYLINDIIKLRYQKAKLLGFQDHNELSLYTKMATNTAQVLNFLEQLAKKSKLQAKHEIAELEDIAKRYAINKLEAWDIPYLSEKLRHEKYNYSNNKLKEYFQLPVVLSGLFSLINQLYGITFTPNKHVPIWHSDTQVFDLINKDNRLIGNLYLDLFARKGKQSGAWMNSAQDKFTYTAQTTQGTQNHSFIPMAYIICNFTPQQGKTPSLLSFEEVQTLFHEMGHALHHLLTDINHYTISGINGVEWDAVELPSQFMEYFTWNYSILRSISKHIDTNDALPIELYDRLIKSRFYQSGLDMLRQLELAIFDLRLHDGNPNNQNYLKLLNNVRRDIAMIPNPSYNRFPNTFSHIFAGGYASGYYSYKWAEVLATDIFEQFDKSGINTYPSLGNKFYTTILAKGGLYPMLHNFKAFMGRVPSINALLKYSGISA